MLAAGKADAFANDDVQLYGMVGGKEVRPRISASSATFSPTPTMR